MSIVMQINPFDFFVDQQGDALNEGYVWIGQPNKDPRQFPVAIYFDEALTIPAAQPLRTNGGYIVRGNAPTFLYINGNYSVLVQDKNGLQVFYIADFLLTGNSRAVSAVELASSGGSALVGHIAAGAGAILRTVQSKLRDIVSRADYATDADFNAAKVGKVSIDGSNNLAANVAPTGGGAPISLGDMALASTSQFPLGCRPALRYESSTSVRFFAKNMPMGQFRIGGAYTGGRARVVPMATEIASLLPAGLGAESTMTLENWYAAFSVANTADATATIKTMPFLRVGSIAGNVITLNKAGEGIHTVQPKTYAWTTPGNLVGKKCLIISENSIYSGRIATITGNTASTVTLDSVGTLAFGDFILPAPPGYDEFGYMGTFYLDTAEVRNIYDTGSQAFSYGIYLLSPSTDGSQPAPGIEMNCAGYISPLATGVTLDSSCAMSTATLGDYAEYFSPDSGNHDIRTNYDLKDNPSSRSFIFSGISFGFLYQQKLYFKNSGSLASIRLSGQIAPRGWYEP